MLKAKAQSVLVSSKDIGSYDFISNNDKIDKPVFEVDKSDKDNSSADKPIPIYSQSVILKPESTKSKAISLFNRFRNKMKKQTDQPRVIEEDYGQEEEEESNPYFDRSNSKK